VALLGQKRGQSNMTSRMPRVFCLWPEALAAARARLQSGDARLAPALDHLSAEADAALDQPPLSVMNKTQLPPSGDRHDYLSFGPYWWPDPAKAGELPFIRRDGEVYPGSKTGSDSPALHQVAATVETLSLAYYFCRKPAYAEHAIRPDRTAPAATTRRHHLSGRGLCRLAGLLA